MGRPTRKLLQEVVSLEQHFSNAAPSGGAQRAKEAALANLVTEIPPLSSDEFTSVCEFMPFIAFWL